MTSSMKTLSWAVLFVVAGLLIRSDDSNSPELRISVTESSESAPTQTEVAFQSAFVEPEGGQPSVHAGTLTQLQDKTILAAWFGGTREGASDVKIYMARLRPDEHVWSVPVVIASPEQTAQDLDRHIAKVGNPVLFADSRGRVWLFYVTVSFGGWSGASVTVRYSDDSGESWSNAERLITSPFLNVSTLVKGCPIECESGHILLPVYHEFLRKFSELLTIRSDGKLVSKKRLTPALGLIQPSVVPLSEKGVRVFYRQNGNRFRTVMTNLIPDISAPGLESVEATDVPNPDSAVSVVRRSNGEFLMVCNPLETGRHKLSLATSADGISWKIVRDIEDSQPPSEFSYPYLVRGIDGEYHLIYTWNRTKMRFASFTEQWLESTP